jgi:WD40 repeat protein
MIAERICEECGARLPENAPSGLCPACLVRMAISLADPPEPAPGASSPIENQKAKTKNPKVRYFGDYELLSEIARGGMGVVYRARQVSLNRLVAVKMLLFGEFSSDESMKRFRTESQAAASLRHPNIVAIHEVGDHEGQPYFSMDLIEGQSLGALVRDKPLPAHQAARYVLTIARAVHYAHQRGVLHRDLKPSNVLVDQHDEPHVTDFGLAKRLPSTLDAALKSMDLTRTGQTLGSPNYMPPEQASPKPDSVGVHSDVYSIGAILYHLLTGRPPFLAETLEATLLQLINTEPVAPRLLNSGTPRDLETICLKCLSKEPGRRYASAALLAEDLERWTDREPILARPVGVPEKVWRWCRRHPAVAALAGTVVVLLTVLGVSSTVAALRLERSAKQTTEKLWESYLAQARAGRLSGVPGRRFESLEVIKKAAAIRPSSELRNEAIACLALLDVRVAKQWGLPHWTEGDNIQFGPRLDRYSFETPEGDVSIRQVKDDLEIGLVPTRVLQGFWTTGFSPDSRYLAILGKQGRNYVWDTVQHEWAWDSLPAVAEICFGPRRDTFANAEEDGTVSLYSLGTRQKIGQVHIRSKPGGRMAFDPEGLRLACYKQAERAIEVWKIESEKMFLSVPFPTFCSDVKWSADGRFLAVASGECAYVLDSQSGKQVTVLKGHQMTLTRLAFNHADDVLATTSWDGTIRLWDPARGIPLLAYPGASLQMQFSEDDHTLACFGLDGKKFGLLQIDTDEDYRLLRSPDHQGISHGLDISRDNRLIAAAGQEGVAFLDLVTGKEIGFLRIGDTGSVLFAPDGGSLLTFGGSGLRSWPIQRVKRGQIEQVHIGLRRDIDPRLMVPMCNAASVSDDGLSVAGVFIAGDAAFVLKSQDQLSILKHTNAAFCSLSPNGQWVATGTWKGEGVKIWAAASGQFMRELPLPTTQVVLFSPDSHWLLTVGDTCQLWEVPSWLRGPSRISPPLNLSATGVAFSPDSKLFALGSTTREIQLFETETAQPVARLQAPYPTQLSCLRFSHDGAQLVAVDTLSHVHVWNLRRLREHLRALNLDWNLPEYSPALKPDAAGLALILPNSLETDMTRQIAKRDPIATWNQIDLSAHFNRSLSDLDGTRSQNGGFTNHSAGLQKLSGILFDLRGTVRLAGSARSDRAGFPEKVAGIEIEHKCRRLHFLHTARGVALEGMQIGHFLIHYSNGSEISLPIIIGQNVGELHPWCWENPLPDLEIRSIDFVSDKTSCAPFLLAITAE